MNQMPPGTAALLCFYGVLITVVFLAIIVVDHCGRSS